MAASSYLHRVQFHEQFQHAREHELGEGAVPLKTRMPVGKTNLAVQHTHTFMTPVGVTYHSENGKRVRRV